MGLWASVATSEMFSIYYPNRNIAKYRSISSKKDISKIFGRIYKYLKIASERLLRDSKNTLKI